jgi:hypothetical protein
MKVAAFCTSGIKVPGKAIAVLVFFAFIFFNAHAQGDSSDSSHNFLVGRTTITYKSTCHGTQSGVVFISLHENEETAAVTANRFLDSLGSHCLVQLVHDKQRLLSVSFLGKTYRLDPNRMWSKQGLEANLRYLNKRFPDELVTQLQRHTLRFRKQFFFNRRLVVALHNNTNNGFSVRSFMKGGGNYQDALEVHLNPAHDPDNFFIVTEQPHFTHLKQLGYSVVLHKRKTSFDDGSLSFLCARNNIPYINAEVEEGNSEKQSEMLMVIHDLINTRLNDQSTSRN